MRKVILTLLFSGIGIYAMGQSLMVAPFNPTPSRQKVVLGAKMMHPQGKTNSTNQISQWYDLLDEAANNGSETYTLGGSDIFSDSTARILYSNNGTDATVYTTLQDVGEVFDPRYEAYDQPLSIFNTYSVDSVALAYLYHYVPEKDTLADSIQNPDGLVHDTLIFQFYTIKTGGVDTASFGPGLQSYATVKYNYKTNLGVSPIGQYKYILGAKDSQTVLNPDNSLPFIVVPTKTGNNNGVSLNLKNKAGYNKDIFAYTVSYRPGFQWKVSDTIDGQGASATITNQHSYFRIFNGENTSKDMPGGIYEMSLAVHSVANETDAQGNQVVYHGGERYNNDPGWPGLYVPGTAWTSFDEVLYSLFYVNMSNDAAINSSVGDPKGYILGNVYPNPANGTAKLNFALGNTQQVKITLYDILGHQIATLADGQFTAGIHTISFNTDNLKEGVYLYSINAGSFTKTLKFSVAHN